MKKKFISVEDRLPDKSCFCLVMFPLGVSIAVFEGQENKVLFQASVAYYYKERGGFIESRMDYPITHWLPLDITTDAMEMDYYLDIEQEDSLRLIRHKPHIDTDTKQQE